MNDIRLGSEKKSSTTCRALQKGESTCDLCSAYNRPCTYTSVSLIKERGWEDLVMSPRLLIAARTIPAPYEEAIVAAEEVDDVVTGATEDEGEDEDEDD
jgi:hypothetical protein